MLNELAYWPTVLADVVTTVINILSIVEVPIDAVRSNN